MDMSICLYVNMFQYIYISINLHWGQIFTGGHQISPIVHPHRKKGSKQWVAQRTTCNVAWLKGIAPDLVIISKRSKAAFFSWLFFFAKNSAGGVSGSIDDQCVVCKYIYILYYWESVSVVVFVVFTREGVVPNVWSTWDMKQLISLDQVNKNIILIYVDPVEFPKHGEHHANKTLASWQHE